MTYAESHLAGWMCQLRMWLCGVRGHPWGSWMFDVPAEEGYGDGCRTCKRCDAYELDLWTERR